MQLLAKSLKGEEIACELMTVLSTELSIPSPKVLAGMHDRASSNNVAMSTVKVIYPHMLDIGCYSHTIDHVGEKFKTPTLDMFGKYWISLFAHSPQARLLWRDRTGQSVKTYSKTRWWSRFEVLKQVMLLFGDVLPFLQEDTQLAPATRAKLLNIFSDLNKKSYLLVELAVVIDIGEHFIKATYSVEGDGPLVFSCFEILSSINATIDNLYLPITEAVVKSLTESDSTSATQWLQYTRSCIDPGLTYFKTKFTDELSGSVAAFKAARLFVPHKVDELKPDVSAIDGLKAFPFLDDSSILDGLKQEFPAYIAKAANVAALVDLLPWWKKYNTDLPNWSAAACKVVLVQPSSAAAERVFSILSTSFGPQQDLALQDYIECSTMLQYNKRYIFEYNYIIYDGIIINYDVFRIVTIFLGIIATKKSNME